MLARVLADLALAAVRRRLDAPLVVWLAARVLDPNGAGRAAVADLRRHFSRAALGRAFETPFFRGTGGEQVYYASITQAAKILDVEKPRAAGTVVPLDQLLVGAAPRRARLALGAIAALRRGRPVSVAAIAVEAGVSERTVFAWLKVSRWPRRKRVALQPVNVTPGALRWLRAAQPGPFIVVHRRGRLRVARRLPNALREKFPTESRQWLARRLRASSPARLAPRVTRGATAGHHLHDPKNTSRGWDSPSFPEVGSELPICQREGEDFGRGRAAP